MCKGKLSSNRPPLIKLSGRQVPFVEEFRYLGITFEHGTRGLKAGKHVEIVSRSSKAMFSGLKRVVNREWGLGFRALKTIYKGLFLAKTTYAASVWIYLINKKDWTKLTSAQRHSLIEVTCSYRSVS